MFKIYFHGYRARLNEYTYMLICFCRKAKDRVKKKRKKADPTNMTEREL